MPPSFDPYYTWLGIPPDEQPPNHYRLLGLKVLESNEEAISNAADRQMMLLRTFQAGEHSTLSQQLLNQVARARICLLNTQQKAAYDAQLQRALSPTETRPPAVVSAETDPVGPGADSSSFDFRPVASGRDPYLARSRRRRSLWGWLAAAGWKTQAVLVMAAVALLLVTVVIFRSRSPRQADPSSVDSAPGTVEEGAPSEVPTDVKPLVKPLVKPPVLAPSTRRLTAAGSSAVKPLVLAPLADQDVPVGEPVVPDGSTVAEGASEPMVEDHSTPQEPIPKPTPPELAEGTVAADSQALDLRVERLPVPDQAAQAEALRKVKERFKSAYASSKPHVRLALAAQLVEESHQVGDVSTERYVLLDEAGSLAAREGDLVLGTIAAEELAQHFQLDGVALKAEALGASIRPARTPAALLPVIEAAFALAGEGLAADSFDAPLSLLSKVMAAARKIGGANLGKSVLQRRSVVLRARQMYEESRPAAARLADNPMDAEANLALGQFYCLAAGDWEIGLPLLAKGRDELLKKPAAKLVSNSADTLAQLELADAWWEKAENLRGKTEEKTMLRNAARHWYHQAVPRLTGLDRMKARGRLGAADSQESAERRQPFALSISGLAGLSTLIPEKVSGEVSPAGGFANFLGKGRIEYTQIPALSYIHEFELTFAKPQGSLELRYGGGYRGVRISFVWMAERGAFQCRVNWYHGGWHNWKGEQNYHVGEKLRFVFYVNENSQILYQNDVRGLSRGGRPTDLRFIVSSGTGTAVNVPYCAFRPWTEVDALARKWNLPPRRVEGNVAETALQWHEHNIDLNDRPIPTDPQPFVVGATGTPMQWAAAGTFQRVDAGAKPQRTPTQVDITRGFWIGRYEITQAEWARLMPLRVSRVTGSPFLPVDGVRWQDAANFCLRLTEREKKARRLPTDYLYRLPTEAEWEYACRAGSTEDFCTGTNDFWSKERSNWRPHEVGTSTPNQWGIYDMHGNVAEWCCEMWQDLPAKPPARLVDPFRPPTGKANLLCWRGGNWWQPQASCAAGVRDSDRSEAAGHTGFRIVLGPMLRSQ